MNQQKPYIITIVGPESSGKTTLARQLAAGYGCPWVPEYAREYLEVLGSDYDETDLSLIAVGQLEAIGEQLAVSSEQLVVGVKQSSVGSKQSAVFSWQSSDGNSQGILANTDILIFQKEDFGDIPRPMVIIDSGMMGMRMWAKIKYNMTIPIVEESLQDDVTSMYVLCRPFLPWESDPLREAPKLLDRAWIYNQYLKEIILLQSK